MKTNLKIDRSYLTGRIAETAYSHPHPRMTLCLLTMANGCIVTGESFCLSEANFSAEIGRDVAYDNAVNKLWELEGYALASEIAAENKRVADNEKFVAECVGVGVGVLTYAEIMKLANGGYVKPPATYVVNHTPAIDIDALTAVLQANPIFQKRGAKK